MNMRDLLALLFLLAATASALPGVYNGRHRDDKTPSRRSCSTNAECLAQGLPLRKPKARRSPSDRKHSVHLEKKAIGETVSFGDCVANPPSALSSFILGPGTYEFVISGGKGGDNSRPGYSFPNFVGGTSAEITATYSWSGNRTIYYRTGCQGQQIVGYGGGGGGASFLAYDNIDTPLIVAGGGGAAGSNANGGSVPVEYTMLGQGTANAPAATVPGYGGASLGGNGGGGGGGFFGDGSPLAGSAGNTGFGGKAFINGAAGGAGQVTGARGGGGGSGASTQNLYDANPSVGGAGGGGGGYTGGSGGSTIPSNSGGGAGGSFYATSTDSGYVSATYKRYSGFYSQGRMSYKQTA